MENFEHEDLFDPLFIGSGIASNCRTTGKLKFKNLSPEAKDMIHRRKLWDFMEDIPLDQDPREVCRSLIFELAEKAEDAD